MVGPPANKRLDLARYSTIGLEFSILVGILGWLGYRLDRFLGLADRFPVFLLLGLFLGVYGGIYRMNRALGSKSPEDGSAQDSEDLE